MRLPRCPCEAFLPGRSLAFRGAGRPDGRRTSPRAPASNEQDDNPSSDKELYVIANTCKWHKRDLRGALATCYLLLVQSLFAKD